MPIIKDHIYANYKFEIKTVELIGKESILEVKMRETNSMLHTPLIIYRIRKSEFKSYQQLFLDIIEEYYERVEREVFKWTF